MTRHYIIIVLLINFTLLAGCGAGARGKLKFDGVRYPLSMSAYLYDSDYNIVTRAKELDIVGQFEYQKRFWGLFYSIIPLSNDEDVATSINSRISETGGDGIINLSVTAYNCLFNSFPIISFLPIMPGCVDSVIRGEIVKLKPKSKVSIKPRTSYILKNK